jgi:hypothetical protein
MPIFPAYLHTKIRIENFGFIIGISTQILLQEGQVSPIIYVFDNTKTTRQNQCLKFKQNYIFN